MGFNARLMFEPLTIVLLLDMYVLVFIAIAKEGSAKGITGKQFIKRHHLQTVSVVTAAVRSLLDKDLITEDKGAYMVYDPFFALWLRRDWI